MQSAVAYATVFGLGFGYFIGAIPAGAAFGLSLFVVPVIAWLGYTLGAVVVILLGEPLRRKLAAKFNLHPRPGTKPGLIHRAWNRYGLPALALLAPVTIGPQLGGILGLALGVSPFRLVSALSLGLIPWAVGITILVALGFRLVAD